MPETYRWNRRRRGLLALSATILLCAACAERAVESGRADETAEAATTAGSPTAASRAYVDPQTGRLIPRSEAGEAEGPAAQAPERLSRYQDDLVEVPLAEGGAMVDLRGRFRSETVVRLDDNGDLQIDCTTAAADSDDGHEHAAAAGESR